MPDRCRHPCPIRLILPHHDEPVPFLLLCTEPAGHEGEHAVMIDAEVPAHV